MPIRSIEVDPGNRLWILGQKNLWALALLEKQLIKIKLADLSDSPRHMALSAHYLFLSTDKGIFRINLKDPSQLEALKLPHTPHREQMSVVLYTLEDQLFWLRSHEILSFDLEGQHREQITLGHLLHPRNYAVFWQNQLWLLKKGILYRSSNFEALETIENITPQTISALDVAEGALLTRSTKGVSLRLPDSQNVLRIDAHHSDILDAHISPHRHCYLFSNGQIERYELGSKKTLFYQSPDQNWPARAKLRCGKSVAAIASTKGIEIYHLKNTD